MMLMQTLMLLKRVKQRNRPFSMKSTKRPHSLDCGYRI